MASHVLAGPPGDCCFKAVKHSGTPVGKRIEIAGVPTYISEPSTQLADGRKKIILYLADVFGPFFLNNQLIQDYLAENGFLVLGIDYFFGDGFGFHLDEEGFDRMAWIENAKVKANEVYPKWLETVRETYGTDARYFSVGKFSPIINKYRYCFGAPFALDLATTNKVSASAFAHPAFLNEEHFTKLTKPLLLLCAESDHTFPLESRRRAEDLLVEAKASYHISVFSGVSHGFAVRCDLEIENERWAKEEAARQTVDWFTRFSQ
ncbi:Protein AIM2 [Termitomyces sp. J132]|nr:Protein AIM2 [Termitomyces sp. J132]